MSCGEVRFISFNIENPPLALSVKTNDGRSYSLFLLLNGSRDVSLLVKTSEKVLDTYLATFINEVRRVSSAIYDAAYFTSGIASMLAFTSIVEIETNRSWKITDEVQELSQLIAERNPPIQETVELSMRDDFFRRAIADLKSALLFPSDTGFYCYRAVETTAQSFGSSTDQSKTPWTELNSALNLNRNFLNPVTKFSDTQRHGKWATMTAAERAEALKTAWIILYRYSQFSMNGRVALPPSDFPELSNPQ